MDVLPEGLSAKKFSLIECPSWPSLRRAWEDSLAGALAVLVEQHQGLP